jgi:predicted 2-oxoglutarate/Fe(II)-dependent dioxygenase YbiX
MVDSGAPAHEIQRAAAFEIILTKQSLMMQRTGRDSGPDGQSVAGLVDLARDLLIGRERAQDVPESIRLLSHAAETGDPQGLELLATVTAVGVVRPPDWPAALDLLQRAAERGSVAAQGQLRLLAKTAQSGRRSWADLRATVDMSQWMAVPPRTVLSESPKVRLVRDFAPPSVCDWLISRVRGRLRPGLTYDGATKIEQVDPHRTCSDYQFDILNADLIVQLMRERIAAVTRLPTIVMEPPRIFHYALGQDIKAHYDRLSDGISGYGTSQYRGDRIATFLLYLNDDFDGGDLYFPKTGFQCKGAKGDGVYFAHVDASGKQDPLSLHAGLPVMRGEKWVMSQWIHDRPFGVPA